MHIIHEHNVGSKTAGLNYAGLDLWRNSKLNEAFNSEQEQKSTAEACSVVNIQSCNYMAFPNPSGDNTFKSPACLSSYDNLKLRLCKRKSR